MTVVKPNKIVWMTLVACCGMEGDFELGEYICRENYQEGMETNNSITCMLLLSNTTRRLKFGSGSSNPKTKSYVKQLLASWWIED